MADIKALQGLTPALTAMRDSGVPFRKAAIVSAISFNESGICFGIPRGPALPYPNSCYPYRQILKLERGGTAAQPLSTAWTSDTDLIARLRSMGYITTLPNGNLMISAASGVAKTDTCWNPNNSLASLFELLIDQRKLGALRSFSVGPTQMYLNYSPALGAAPGIASRFKTIDELWAFYTARSVGELMSSSAFDYLPTGRADYPTPSNLASHKSYLTAVQTGNVDWSQPAWSNYAAGFSSNVQSVWSAARSISYPNMA